MITESTGPLREALGALDILIQDNATRADNALASSALRERQSDQVAVVGFLMAFIILALVVFTSFGLLYRPLLKIHQAIVKFSDGDSTSRAPLVGLTEISVIASEFNRLADQTVQINRRRLQFLAATAHDLRNPLTALKTAVLLLSQRFDKLGEKQRLDGLRLIERQVVRLESMTTDFLDAIRLDSGEFTLEMRRADLGQVLKDVIELWSTANEKHSLISSFPKDTVYVDCDPMRIGQVFTNLISNALKYSPAGGMVEIGLSWSGDMAQISVRDHGIGIAPEEIGRIFEPFHRTIRAQQMVPGVGIGLWVTKRLVDAHQGRIRVESVVGKGTTFVVEFPIAVAERRAS